MATIHVDGRPFEVDPRANLLAACLSAGLDIPYFCWHPALGSVGACRQCAVKQYASADDNVGRLVMACMTPAADGTRISIGDEEASAFRASVIEWLMTNHPHDCPVCEEGGECHLQDMTLMTGHTYRRYRFQKRTHRNQYLGPFVKHEMNRCIACYRCVRFYRDYAGGRDLDVFAIHNDVYFGRQADGVLENEFSGNLVEVCPTGVFTDKTLSAQYVRKWDLEGAPSVCVHCGLGCNTIPNARAGRLRRILNRYHGAVNGYFLCDRGRFGYGFVEADTRIRTPLRAQGEVAHVTTTDVLLPELARVLSEGEAIGIGSPRASLEANFALRDLVGPDRFHLGVSEQEEKLLAVILAILRAPPAPVASLSEAETCDAVVVLGDDVADSAPRLALSLRQAVRQASFAAAAAQRVPVWQDASVRDAARDHRSPLFIATPLPSRLDDVATECMRAAPDDIARFGFALAHALDAQAPEVPELDRETRRRAEALAGKLRGAARPLVVSGAACGSEAVLRAAEALARALAATGRDARLVLTAAECNSLGLALLGGKPLAGALEALSAGGAHTVIVLENDLYRRADAAQVTRALDAARHVLVLDHTLTETARRAHTVLPAATFAEGDGTLVNNEGRAQRFFQLLFPETEVAESWRWLDRLAVASRKRSEYWQRLDHVIAALAEAAPALAPIAAAAPDKSFRVAGLPVRSLPHRASGRTALDVNQFRVREPIPRRNPDAPFTHSMEGYYGRMPAALYPFFWAPGWNSAQAVHKFQQEVGGPLQGGDAGVLLFQATSSAPPSRPSGPTQESLPAFVRDRHTINVSIQRPRSEEGEQNAFASSQEEGRRAAPGSYGSPIVPPAFARREGEWLVVAGYPLFGAEELSAHAPALAERIGRAELALAPADAAALGLQPGDRVELGHAGERHHFALRLEPALVPGLAAVTAGLPDAPWLPLPLWARIGRAAGPSR